MDILLRELAENAGVKSILKKESVLGNLSLSEEALLIASAYRMQPQSMFIVKNNAYSAQKLYDRLSALLKEDVLLFTMEESLRVEAVASSPETRANQMEVMGKLLEDRPYICVMNTAGAIRFQPSKEQFEKHTLSLKQDEEIAYDDLKRLLQEAGYTHVNRVDQPLCYAARGGIIDVFSMNYEHPIRIEFFDNIIDSIRFFDISTQRTIEVIQEIKILPASTFLFEEKQLEEIRQSVIKEFEKQKKHLPEDMQENLYDTILEDLDMLQRREVEGKLYRYYAFQKDKSTLCDYRKDAWILVSSKEEVKESIKHIQEETVSYLQELFEEGRALCKFSVFEDMNHVLQGHEVLEFGMFVDYKKPVSSNILSMSLGDVSLERTMQEVLSQAKNRRVLLCLDEKEIVQIKRILQEENVSYHLVEEEDALEEGISLLQHAMVEGFTCVNENIAVYTSKELFHKTQKTSRFANKFKEAEVLHNYEELSVGDYVVHNQHGVGKYLGIVTRNNDGMHKDYLHVVYKGDASLYIPLEQFHLIRKFISKEGASPKLNTLGSKEWEKTKRKVSKKIAELADRLLHLYAQRDENIGYAFAPDTPLQADFEKDFPYELTRDQAKAVKEIKRDMESSKPMDRLLCGDVGFGKTEVAARAAFKAVADNKQVAFLCPTTILSLQHYKTFVKRFQNFPVQIAVINRFVPLKEQKKLLHDVKEGNIDILIGTHRLLSKDVEFSDLGLLVIDEEQRFGVEHKEKIKELKNSVDVLSLSATPIPRTLQMSLIGIRSLSQLDTPPSNRMPVQTYVIEKNFSMIKEVIQRELARNGQVFYLFNNVKEIYNVARKLREALPDIEVGVAHGKMSREEIEDVMLQFTDNHYQVLVCTTIIETGIDIPNANTIIIEDADHFGLSQLYQIKGRVGRSDRLAYAYLMYSPQKQLSEVAGKRLKSIKEFTQLGSGYKIAMRDLTIRGAGDMLGPQQAGFIDTVGIDMYIEMLNEAIMERKGIKKEEKLVMKKANVAVDAYIPGKFANEDYEKITLYQRIEAIQTKEQLRDMMEEIKDNYGKLPKSVQMLFEKKRLDILINEPIVDTFMEEPKRIRISFSENWSNRIDGVKFFERMTTISKNIQMRFVDKKISVFFPKSKDWLFKVIEILESCERMELKEE